MSKIPVYSFCTYSDTGKTAFLKRLIRELKDRGVRAAAGKHDAHEAPCPVIDIEDVGGMAGFLLPRTARKGNRL